MTTDLVATTSDTPPPPGWEDFAGEVQTANGKMPRWFTWVPYVGIVWALAYYAWLAVAETIDPINLVFAALFVLWMIYTPIAQKRGWFFIPM